jgi:hypothetical protein
LTFQTLVFVLIGSFFSCHIVFSSILGCTSRIVATVLPWFTAMYLFKT